MKLIYNAIQTPDGTVIQSRHRHNYVTHQDKNGNIYMVDGGLDYSRRSANGDEIDLCLYDNEPHEKQRDILSWGSYGKNGDEDLHYITIADMETDHIKAVLRECMPATVLKNCMYKELEERNDR